MVSSELNRQLAKHRKVAGLSELPPASYGKKREAPTILYDPKDALSLDIDELRKKAENSFEVLVSTVDPDLASLGDLFRLTRTQYLTKKRGFLTPDQCKQVDELINRFLYRVGSYWQDEKVLDCLEFLIRQFSIHKYNVEALLGISLPQHDTPLFGRVVRILDLPDNSPFRFLDAVKKTSSPLKRSVFVQNCTRQPGLLSFLGNALIKSCTERPNIPLTSFFVLVCIEALGSPDLNPSEKLLRQIIPCLFFALQNPTLRELHIGSLCILSQLSQRVPLSNQTCTAVLVQLFGGIFKGINSLTRKQIALTEAFMFLNLLVLGQSSSNLLLPSNLLEQFCRYEVDIIPSIYNVGSSRVEISGLLGCLFRSIFHEMRISNKPKLRESLAKFAVEFIRRGAEHKTSLLGSKCRSTICLAAFDVICAAKDVKEASESLAPSLRAIEDLYPTSIAAALRHIVESQNSDPPVLARIIGSVSTALNGSLTAPLSSQVSSDVNPGFSIWTAMADPSAEVRLEAVGVALSRLKQFFESDAGSGVKHVGLPAGVRLLCDVLLDRSTDRLLPVAELVFSDECLWRRSPPCVSLSCLFQQLYLIVHRVGSTDPWDFSVDHETLRLSSSVIDVLVILISSSDALMRRFALILRALGVVLSECPSEVVKTAMDQLSPILLPLGWSLSGSRFRKDDRVNDLRDAVVSLFEIFDDHVPSDVPFIGKKKKKSDNSTSKISRDRLASSLMSFSLPDGQSVAPKLGPVTVVSFVQEGVACPIVETTSEYMLGGVWPLLGRIEASSEIESDEGVEETLKLAVTIWTSAVGGSHAEAEGMRLTRSTMNMFLSSVVTKSTDVRKSSAIILGLCNIIEPDTLMTLLPLSALTPILAFVLAGGDSLVLTPALSTIARASSARILGQIMESGNNDDCVKFLAGPALIGLDYSDACIRTECLKLVRIIYKLSSEFEMSIDLWKDVVEFPQGENMSHFENIFKSFDSRPFFKSILKKTSDISLGVFSLKTFVERSDQAVGCFIATLAVILCPKCLTGARTLLGLLDDVPFESIAKDICLPVWDACLSGRQCDKLGLLGEHLTRTLEKAKRDENAKPFIKRLWSKIIKPFCKENETAPDPATCRLFIALVKSFINSENLDLLENPSQLLKLLTRTAVRWDSTSLGQDSSNDSLPRSLCTLLRDSGASRFSASVWISRLENEDAESGVRELILVVECLTISLNQLGSQWTSELRLGLMGQLVDRITADLDQLRLLSIVSIVRCLTRAISLGLDGIEEQTLGLVSLCIERCGELVKSRELQSDVLTDELICPLLNLMSQFAVTWDREGDFDPKNSRKIDEILDQFISCVLLKELRNNTALLDSPNVMSSLKSAVPHLLKSCLPHDQMSRRVGIQRRSLIFVNYLTPAILTGHLRRCFSSVTEGHPLDDHRAQQESENLQKKILVMATSMGDDSVAVASLLFATICLWGRELNKIGINSNKMDENEKTHQGVSTDRWIIQLISDVLNKLQSHHLVIREMCTLGFTYLPVALESKSTQTENKDELPTLSRGEDIRLYENLILPEDLNNKKIPFLPKCLYINLSVIHKYIHSTGCPVLDDPDLITHDEVAYKSSVEAQWVTQLLETFLLISTHLERAPKLSSRIVPLRELVGRMAREMVQNVSLLLGTCQLVHEAFSSKVHSTIIGQLLHMIRSCHFTPRLTPIIASSKPAPPKTEQRKKRKAVKEKKDVKDEASVEEPFCPLSEKEVENAVKIEGLISSTVSLVSALCTSGDKSSKNKNALSVSNTGIIAASFLADFVLVAGAALPAVLESVWTSQLSHHLTVLFKNISSSDNQISRVLDAWGFVLCRNIFSMVTALPTHSYLSSLNSLMDTLINIIEILISRPSPLLRSVVLALTSLLSLPSRHFISHHLPRVIDKLLVNPHVIVNVLLDASPVFSSAFNVLESLSKPRTGITLGTTQNAVGLSLLADDDTSAPSAEFKTFSGLWRHLFYLTATTSPLRSVVSSLTTSAKSLAKQISKSEDPLPALQFGASLALLSAALDVATPESAALHHKDISALLLIAAHAACVHVEFVSGKSNVVEILSTDVQSGVVESLFYTPQTARRLECRSSVLDLSRSVDAWKGREFGVLESGICLSLKSWLPKMTNSHLQPFLKSLLKYCRRGNEVLMASPEQNWTDREAAGARLFVVAFSVVAVELGDLGIVGCLMEVAPDLNQILVASTRNAFQQSMAAGGQKQSKKSKRAAVAQRLSSTWWWADLCLPCLYCLGLSSTATSNSTALIESTLPSVIDTLDLFAVVERPSIPPESEESKEGEGEEDAVGLGDVLLAGCSTAIINLTESVIEDQIQMQTVVRRLLDKVQSAKNSSVRLGTILVLIGVWSTQGLALLPTLSDSLQVFVELLEDHDDDVARASRRLVQVIERITGESLESRLRQ